MTAGCSDVLVLTCQRRQVLSCSQLLHQGAAYHWAIWANSLLVAGIGMSDPLCPSILPDEPPSTVWMQPGMGCGFDARANSALF